MSMPSVSLPELLDADGGDRGFRRLVYDLLAIGVRMQDIRDRLAAELGVTGPQYAILMAISHLQHEEGGAGVRVVARRLHVSGPFVTAQVNRLVELDLVEKRPNPADGRGVLLVLAAEGIRRLKRTVPLIQRANDVFFSALNKTDFVVLCDIAARLEDSAERAVGNFDDLVGREDEFAGGQ